MDIAIGINVAIFHPHIWKSFSWNINSIHYICVAEKLWQYYKLISVSFKCISQFHSVWLIMNLKWQEHIVYAKIIFIKIKKQWGLPSGSTGYGTVVAYRCAPWSWVKSWLFQCQPWLVAGLGLFTQDPRFISSLWPPCQLLGCRQSSCYNCKWNVFLWLRSFQAWLVERKWIKKQLETSHALQGSVCLSTLPHWLPAEIAALNVAV